jgi:CIC family chloride channel protein
VIAFEEEGVEAIMKKFEDTGADILPVTSNRRYVGFLTKLSVLENYRERLKEMVID